MANATFHSSIASFFKTPQTKSTETPQKSEEPTNKAKTTTIPLVTPNERKSHAKTAKKRSNNIKQNNKKTNHVNRITLTDEQRIEIIEIRRNVNIQILSWDKITT
jgi:hypothetical protein